MTKESGKQQIETGGRKGREGEIERQEGEGEKRGGKGTEGDEGEETKKKNGPADNAREVGVPERVGHRLE